MKASTAPAQTKTPSETVLRLLARGALRTDGQRNRVVKAAVEAVYRDFCSNSVAELQAAVVDLMGVPLESDDDQPESPTLTSQEPTNV